MKKNEDQQPNQADQAQVASAAAADKMITSQQEAQLKSYMPNISPTGGNIDKIRDILFGTQMREYDKKFQRLEARMLKEFSGVRQETKDRMDSLEAFMKQEIETLSGRLRSEQNDRTRTDKEIMTELKDTGKMLEQKITELDELNAKAQRDLRQQLLEQSKSLRDMMQQRYEELNQALDRATRELRGEKVDRAALANLFTELAMRLHNESSLDLNLEMGIDEQPFGTI